jgi:hypothetical protein
MFILFHTWHGIENLFTARLRSFITLRRSSGKRGHVRYRAGIHVNTNILPTAIPSLNWLNPMGTIYCHFLRSEG